MKIKNLTPPILISGISIYFLFTVVSSYLLFKQFTFFNIISISLLFLALLIGLVFLFMRDFFDQELKLKINPINAISVIVIFCTLVIYANSQSEQYLNYYRAFPFIEIELGLGWHQDTAFHVSIIQSILNFGYPSIGQHDSPIIIYHVLSHYVDAIALYVTGLDPLDSYGLLYYFKTFLLISSIAIFIAQTLKKNPPILFIIALIIYIPIVIGTWRIIGSHGMWFVSILTIITIPKVFGIIVSNSRVSNKDYLFLFLLLVIISLGKVSLGFIYAVFIGFNLLLLNFKDYRTYILGLCWILFFLSFFILMSGSEGPTSLSANVEYKNLASRLNIYSSFTGKQILQACLSICILLATSYLYKCKFSLKSAFSAIIALVFFFAITQLYSGFSRAVVSHFSTALSLILVLFSFKYIVYCANKNKSNINKFKMKNTFVLILVFFVFTGIFNLLVNPFDSFSLYDPNKNNISSTIKNFNLSPIEQIKKRISRVDENKRRFYMGQVNFDLKNDPKRSLSIFKKSLAVYMQQQTLSKRNSLLYIPSNIYDSYISTLGGRSWASGMLIYAATGIPMVHGIGKLTRLYGFNDYGEKALRVNAENFDPNISCQLSKKIIVASSFSPASFFHFDCSNIDAYQAHKINSNKIQ